MTDPSASDDDSTSANLGATKPSAAIYFVVEASDSTGAGLDYVRKGIWLFQKEARERNLALGLTLHPRRSFDYVKPCKTTHDCPWGAQCSSEVVFQDCGNLSCSAQEPVGRCPHSLTTCSETHSCVAFSSHAVCDLTPFCIPAPGWCEGSAYSQPNVPLTHADESASAIVATILAHYPGGRADAFEGAYRGALANVERFTAANPGVPAAIVVVTSNPYFTGRCTTERNVVELARSAFASSRIRTFGTNSNRNYSTSSLRLMVEAGGGGAPWDAPTPEKLAVALHQVAGALETPLR